MIGFAKGETDKGTLQQIRVTQHTQVRDTIKYQMLIHFIADNKDTGIGYQLSQRYTFPECWFGR